jgi:hypothetical protein
VGAGGTVFDMNLLRGLATIIVSMGVLACGEDEAHMAPMPGEFQESVARTLAGSVYTAVDFAVNADDGNGSARHWGNYASTAYLMVKPATSGAMRVGSSSQAIECVCNDGTCSFDGCEAEGGGRDQFGTMSWTASSMSCDFEVISNADATLPPFRFDVHCDLTFSANLGEISGTVATSGQFDDDGTGSVVAWDSHMTLNAVLYEPQSGSPSAQGGGLEVDATTTIDGQPHTATGSVSL